jgi:hypothetical protein
MQLEMRRVGADRHRRMGHIGDRKTDHRVDDPLHFERSCMSQVGRRETPALEYHRYIEDHLQ